MRIDEFEFRNKKGEEIEPTKEQLVVYIKSLHKKIKELEYKPIQMANHIQDITYFHAKVGSKWLNIERNVFDDIIKKSKEEI